MRGLKNTLKNRRENFFLTLKQASLTRNIKGLLIIGYYALVLFTVSFCPISLPRSPNLSWQTAAPPQAWFYRRFLSVTRTFFLPTVTKYLLIGVHLIVRVFYVFFTLQY